MGLGGCSLPPSFSLELERVAEEVEEKEEGGLGEELASPEAAARRGWEKRLRDSLQQAPLTTLSLSASTGV